MGKVVCKKCGIGMDTVTKNGLCEDCAKKRKKLIIKGMAFTAVVGAGVTAGVVYVKKNPEIIDDFKKAFSKVPSLFKREELPAADAVPAAIDLMEEMDKVNYLTDIDLKKIDMAYKRGVFDKSMIKRQRGMWESGYSTVDEFLRTWGATDIIDFFPKWKDSVGDITREQFEDIVMKAAKNVPDIKDVKVLGDQIQLTIKSKSGKSTWNAFLNFFDKNGNLSLNCECCGGYPGGNVPRFFADEIRKQMKYLIETQMERFQLFDHLRTE